MIRALFPLLVLGASLATTTSGQEPIVPLQPQPLDSLADFRPADPNWVIGGGVAGPMLTQPTMEILPGSGILSSPTPPNSGGNILTRWEHGDLELEFEFLLAKGGNSGTFFQGRYEVQLYESWLRPADQLRVLDLGAIYQRWTDEGGGWDGHPPPVNAARAPGLWQKAHIKFRAPRFDESGAKIANARFELVEINGVVLHENVELSGPTRGAMFEEEGPAGPLMIQGGHGPVAFRNMRYKATAPGNLKVSDLSYAWYPGNHRQFEDYLFETGPAAEGKATEFDPRMSGASGTGMLRVDAKFDAPRAGIYGFRTTGFGGRTEVSLDGEVVADSRASATGTVELTAGSHDLQVRYMRFFGRGQPGFSVLAEGPGMEPQLLTTPLPSPPEPPRILLDPEDHVLAQRGFVSHGDIMQFDSVSIGFPSRIHFAYDLAGGAPLKAWRGAFLDMTDMWNHRGQDQIARSRGEAVELIGLPTVALLQADHQPWPTAPDPALRELGYDRDAAGVPTFHTRLGPLVIDDRIEPLADGSGLRRTIVATGRSMNDDPRFLLAAGASITPEGDNVFVIGDRGYYIVWEGAEVVPIEDEDDDPPGRRDPPPEPFVRESNGRQELLVRFPNNEAGQKIIRYTLIW